MQVQIGPLPIDSARAWLAYAKDVVGAMIRQLPIQVAASFSAYLEEWGEAAAEGDVFLWEGKAEPEEVEYLLHAWFNLAKTVEEQRERTGEPVPPPEGEVFYNALVTGLLNALRSESRATAEFAEHLAPFWPRLN
jgi:hypothetical protein